jgi:hypothetical protein
MTSTTSIDPIIMTKEGHIQTLLTELEKCINRLKTKPENYDRIFQEILTIQNKVNQLKNEYENRIVDTEAGANTIIDLIDEIVNIEGPDFASNMTQYTHPTGELIITDAKFEDINKFKSFIDNDIQNKIEEFQADHTGNISIIKNKIDEINSKMMEINELISSLNSKYTNIELDGTITNVNYFNEIIDIIYQRQNINYYLNMYNLI